MRRPRLSTWVSAFVFTTLLLLFIFRYDVYEYQDRRAVAEKLKLYSIAEEDPPGIYSWQTKSAFDPVRIQDAMSKPTAELCSSFPTHLLDNIQPVMKTGHEVLDDRMIPQLHGPSACLQNLLIFSDLDEEYEGHSIRNVIADIPKHLTSGTRLLNAWRKLQKAAADGVLSQFKQKEDDGWLTDKFKFLPGISRAWDLRPERAWYIFFEADTYIVWDNVFRLLQQFDPDEPLYFGSPTPGRGDTWFANGGPGLIISRAAMRKLVADDHDPETGEFLGSILSEKEWSNVLDDCCGDSMVGWALAKRDVFLSGLYPLFHPHPPHELSFMDRNWCQPVLTMHKPLEDDVVNLWRWEWTQRQIDRPLLYRDIAIDYLNLTTLTQRVDWYNGADYTFEPPEEANNIDAPNPHKSAEACAIACAGYGSCVQWNYHLRKCAFNWTFRLGAHFEPGTGETDEVKPSWIWKILGWGESVESKPNWNAEDLRYISGWNSRKIQRWVDNHACKEAHWVKPSLKRVF